MKLEPRDRLGDELDVGDRHGERVVDLVGHAGGERARRRHALRDHELLAHPLLVRAGLTLPQLARDRDGQPGQIPLEDVVLGAGLHGLDRHRFPDASRDQDEGDVEPGLSQIREREETSVSRHRVVRHDRVPVGRREGGFELDLGRDPLHVEDVAPPLQLPHDERGVVVRVFDEEKAQRPAVLESELPVIAHAGDDPADARPALRRSRVVPGGPAPCSLRALHRKPPRGLARNSDNLEPLTITAGSARARGLFAPHGGGGGGGGPMAPCRCRGSRIAPPVRENARTRRTRPFHVPRAMCLELSC